MVRTLLKVYMELSSYVLFLQEQIKDIIISKQQLNVDQYTLLKKPMEHLGKQLNVPGSFWQGRMSEDERDKIYKCTIVDFSLAQKVVPNSSPKMAFKLLEHSRQSFSSSSGVLGSGALAFGGRTHSLQL